MSDTTRIEVGGAAPYEVLVGSGLLDELPGAVGDARAVAVMHPPALREVGSRVVDRLRAAGYAAHRLVVPDGEAAKDVHVASYSWSVLARIGVDRADAVVSVGGGATTDLAGFVAATWLRGIRVVHVPTTVLAMVDAAVGGKTGINTEAGKNLVGAFHPPAGVLCDLDLLSTLPGEEFAAGMAEVAKAGFIADPDILRLIEDDPAGARRADGPHTRELVERAIAVKAAVVTADLREAGPREALNYGHTLGHAIERLEHYRMRHGEAVSVGLVFAAELAHAAGRIDADLVARHRSVLRALGLPTTHAADAWPRLYDAMRVDKKSRGGRLRFVVLDGLGYTAILDDPARELLDQAYAKVSA